MRDDVVGYANVLGCLIEWSAEREAERAARFCVELMTLHIDIPLNVDSLDESYSRIAVAESEGSARALLMKKFVVIRTEQDIAYRVYAYREKLYELVNVACEVGIAASARKRAEEILRRVTRAYPRIAEVLRVFESHEEIRALMELRHRFTHQYTEQEMAVLGSLPRLMQHLDMDGCSKEFRRLDADGVTVSSWQVDEQKVATEQRLRAVEGELMRCQDRVSAELVRKFRVGTG